MKKPSTSIRASRASDTEFVRRVLILIGLAALAAAFYELSDILLLIFGAVLVAVVLRTIARPIKAGTAMSERVALLASGLGVAIVIGGTGYLFGSQVSDQLSSLSASLPQAAKSLQQTAPGLSLTAMVKGTSIGDLVLNVGAAAALVASRNRLRLQHSRRIEGP